MVKRAFGCTKRSFKHAEWFITYLLLRYAQHQLCQCARRKARRPLFLLRQRIIEEVHTGDIQVCPLRITHKIFQNFSRGHRRSLPSAGLLNVGDIALDPSKGYHVFERFLQPPVLVTPTITTQANYGNGLKAFGDTGGTILSTGGAATGLAGEGFTWETQDRERDTLMAQKGWEVALRYLTDAAYRMILLDEVNVALRKGYLTVEQVLAGLEKKPLLSHVVLTGRGAPPELIARADLVTEMTLVKHPFKDQRVRAQPGVEF